MADKDEFDQEIEGDACFDFDEGENIEEDECFDGIVTTECEEGHGEVDVGGVNEDGETGLFPTESVDQYHDFSKNPGQHHVELKLSPLNNTGTSAANPENCGDEEMDDGLDYIMSQVNENINDEVKVTPPNIAGKTSGSHIKQAGNNYSPAKRANSSEISQFFLSQADSGYDDSSGDNGKPPSVKRTFPGPAGLLPNVVPFIKSGVQITIESVLPKHDVLPDINKSYTIKQIQSSNSTKPKIECDHEQEGERPKGAKRSFSNRPWRVLMKALNINIKDDDSLLNIMNVDWVKSKSKRFPDTVKIPLLVLVVKADLSAVDENLKSQNCIKVMDHSGTIIATLDDSFMKAYGNKVISGTSFALRNCRIIPIRYGKLTKIILLILKRNVLFLSTAKNIEEEDDLFSSSNKNASHQTIFPRKNENPDGTTLLQMAPWAPDKIMEDYQDLLQCLIEERSSYQFEQENSEEFNNWKTSKKPLYSATNTNINNVLNRANQNVGITCPNNEYTSPGLSKNNGDGFEDDDDEEFLQAIQGIDFNIIGKTPNP